MYFSHAHISLYPNNSNNYHKPSKIHFKRIKQITICPKGNQIFLFLIKMKTNFKIEVMFPFIKFSKVCKNKNIYWRRRSTNIIPLGTGTKHLLVQLRLIDMYEDRVRTIKGPFNKENTNFVLKCKITFLPNR